MTKKFEAMMSIVGKTNPRDMRIQLYVTPGNEEADQFGVQLFKTNKKFIYFVGIYTTIFYRITFYFDLSIMR